MRTGKDILQRFQWRWRLLLWLEIVLYAVGAALSVAFITLNLKLGLLVFLFVGVGAMFLIRPWEIRLKDIPGYIDRRLDSMEYSSQLLLIPGEHLSPLALLQREKVVTRLEPHIKSIQPENNVLRAGGIALFLVIVGFLGMKSGWIEGLHSKKIPPQKEERIVLHPIDSLVQSNAAPIITKQTVTVQYPEYTSIPPTTTSKMDLVVLEGSQITWEIAFDTTIDRALMEITGNSYVMNFSRGTYSRSTSLKTSGFYNFRFFDHSGLAFMTDLYSIRVIRDKAPEIEIPDLRKFTSFEYDEKKQVDFTAVITDDFGIADVYIIATVSKGTGESVKFREVKLPFDSEVESGSKHLKLDKSIDLDKMKLEVGDELYFYIEVQDLKKPQSNLGRSETYFAVIKDTASYRTGVEGTLGVDLMPDYYRSQRQLIIDTEKLIGDRNKIRQQEFNATSNDLGFDQKALRLRYGQFMGDENQGGIAPSENNEISEEDVTEPLAEFIHDHDGDNEHNLVETGPDNKEEVAGNEDVLEKFLHDHGDPESATLFTDNLRSKLRQALDIMWDAELHLRLYEPEKSLPFQYKALALIQEIKNSARIYVHRIGYDPPPIKEEVRLTGKIDDVSNFQKISELKKSATEPYMREAIERLEQLLQEGALIKAGDQELFKLAGNELAQKALETPGKHLQTLQQLKWLTETNEVPTQLLQQVQRGLLQAVSKPEIHPGKGKNFPGVLHKLVLKELEKNDQ